MQVTRDGGKTWQRATIPELNPLDTISMIEASPFNPGEAYVVMDRHDWGDFRPYIYRPGDYGRTWSAITLGIPNEDFVRVVRADPKSQGLLYAGTENGAFVSFIDGKQWQSLQLNLPTASVLYLAIRDGDLVAATFGRAFWILDDLSPLRQLTAHVAAAEVATVADYWMANPQPLPTRAGMNRFVWDLRYMPPPAVKHPYPMSAIPHATPAGPQGPLVVPGKYVVKLTVDGATYTQPLTVRRDPRVTATPSDFAAQFALEQKLMAGMRESYQAWQKAEQQGDSAAARQFAGKNGALNGLAATIEGADAAPTPAMYDAVRLELEQLTARLHTSK